MPLVTAEKVFSLPGLNGMVQVDWGALTGARENLVAAAGPIVYLFTASNTGYVLSSRADVGTQVLSLAAGLPISNGAVDNIVLGMEDRVALYGSRQGALVRLAETQPEPGARFADLALADLDGDGREEIIAAPEGMASLFFYRLFGQRDADLRLELLAIRLLPGTAQKVVTFRRKGNATPVVAVAYRRNGHSGLLTLIFTERGFAEGPALADLPALVTSLTAGDLRTGPEEELAWGGSDGFLRILESDGSLTPVFTSDNLGSGIPALTAGRLAGESTVTLVAGTPEGYIFGYRSPVENSAPDWAVRAGSPVNDLAVSGEGLLGLGTADGGVQVWVLSGPNGLIHTVRPGETLFTIAGRYGTTVQAIVDANMIADPAMIFPGQILRIP
ncbi:MAG TPA: LysM peptidoglycan-binding domain-containing protein [Bacillota bacterium]|nr:LysM peptidoglycan-binding domain-containing protein [Peptococcaceae bacterium MAG4]HPZ43560.1 LysM peptidoglycan-binding domain-containing protein [Bacillota bacterium]HQD76081.1 LysM peptidoglycan-binding domain-containing protein [Bacillota bacterium]HUM58770.1 LysM peptidoglycan-binding domain-containing protein [Bacillota bacterium]